MKPSSLYFRPIVAAMLLGFLPATARADRPAEISLDGTWEFQRAADLDAPPAADAWKPCPVPGTLEGYDYQRAWLRRSFEIDPAMRGQHLFLRFDGVKYNSRVLVNGRPVGGCFGGYRAFELDVTAAVQFDKPNELLVGVHDWTGIFSPGKVDFSTAEGWEQVRYAPRDKVLAPVGGLYGSFGIWGDVTLVARPDVSIESVRIETSVRRGEIVARYVLTNRTDQPVEVELTARVEDGGRTALTLPPQTVTIPAGGTAEATLSQTWSDPPLWSHLDPHLLWLKSGLGTGDRLDRRFGFREFWIEGRHFYLNGKKINLLATSWWPEREAMEPEAIRRHWQAVKDSGCVAFRTHTQPWRHIHYDLADEMGLLMIPEGAVWNDDEIYRIDDPAFWDNYAAHLESMVRDYDRHPSVVMWSLDNEFYGSRLNDQSPAKADLIRMGELVRRLDPTRPFFHESDGDPGGAADVVGIHYPHEYPDYTCWPNEALWLGQVQPILGQMFPNGQETFDYAALKKPLYVGEFLWIPSSDPSWHTVFFGDEAYRDYEKYRQLAKGESWRMQILGYRHFGVAGISPWTMIEGGPLDDSNPLVQAHRYAYQPIAAYAMNYDRRFFGGRTIRRSVDVFNDFPADSDLTLRWKLLDGDVIVAEGQQSLQLGPAERQSLEIDLPLPTVEKRTPMDWTLELIRDGKTVFQDTHHYDVFPVPVPLKDAPTIAIYDPAGRTSRLLEQLGAKLEPIENLDALASRKTSVVWIGDDALKDSPQSMPTIGGVTGHRDAVEKFLRGGGRLIVLKQSVYPEGLLPVRLDENHRSTMTFPVDSADPLLRNVEPDDLKFWFGDHLVTDREPVRPDGGAAMPVVVSGSAQGLNHAPLLRLKIGEGLLICSQLRLTEKGLDEPAALQILRNLDEQSWRGMLSRPDLPTKTLLLGGDAAYARRLESLGVRTDRVESDAEVPSLYDYRLVICRDLPNGFDIKPLAAFVRQGGNLLVHRPEADDFARLGEAFSWDVALRPMESSLERAESLPAGFGSLPREDVYWIGEHLGQNWATTPRDMAMCDGGFTKTLAGKTAVSLPPVTEWKLQGQIVRQQSDHVVFATVGSAETTIQIPQDGPYVIGLQGRGSSCEGIYPLMRISIDGQPWDSVPLGGETSETATGWGRLSAGEHRLEVAFVNDGSSPTEDRNAFLFGVVMAADTGDGTFQPLSRPAAILAGRFGEGLAVLDRSRWDTVRRSDVQARRLAAGLLTALGADFESAAGDRIECEAMQPQPGMAHFHNYGDSVAMATNGFVETPVRIDRPGRYRMQIRARGTAVEEVYPEVVVQLDDREIARLKLESDAWVDYPLEEVDLPEGKHRLSIHFVNDKNIPGISDRNLYLDRLVFRQEP